MPHGRRSLIPPLALNGNLNMNKKTFCILSVICLTVFLNGCFNKSRLPLSRPENSQPDSSLTGAWYGVIDGKDAYLHVIPNGSPDAKAWMDLVHVVHPKRGEKGKGEDALLLHMFQTVAAGKKFMNVLFRRPRDSAGGLCEVEEYYWFWKYEVSREGVLTVWELDDEVLRLALEDEKLKGRYRKVNIYLEDSSENILAYLLSSEGEKAFRIYGQFKKIR
jgi:hypothetical protein